MKLKYIIIIFIIIIISIYLKFSKSINNNELASPLLNLADQKPFSTVTPSPSPTPTPIIYDSKTNVLEELKQSSPPDFNEDFKKLKDQIAF